MGRGEGSRENRGIKNGSKRKLRVVVPLLRGCAGNGGTSSVSSTYRFGTPISRLGYGEACRGFGAERKRPPEARAVSHFDCKCLISRLDPGSPGSPLTLAPRSGRGHGRARGPDCAVECVGLGGDDFAADRNRAVFWRFCFFWRGNFTSSQAFKFERRSLIL